LDQTSVLFWPLPRARLGKRRSFPLSSNNLPLQSSPLVGRATEVESGITLLRSDTVRLLTVTGPGGVGKTCLALELARSVEAAFPDGVVFTELGSVEEASLVAPTVATALALRQTDTQSPLEVLQAQLRDKRLLLVLDNCEHLLDAARQLVVALLQVAPALRILATSRSPLRARGERLLPLDPLEVPHQGMSVEELAMVPAIALFVERAQAIRPSFQLAEENARDVAVVCRQLDGLPLALELAAIRLRTLSPQALARLLDQRLRLLAAGPEDAPARHRTLRAAIAWSYDLLTAEQQWMFRVLGVFAGGCTLESIAAFLASGDPFIALDQLEALGDQGLVRRLDEPDGDVRFTMLETIRDYAVELLSERGEDTAIRSRHAESFLALAEQIEPQLHGPQPGRWLVQLEQELDNFRAALAWSLGPTGDTVVALRLAVTLWTFWHMRGHHHEAEPGSSARLPKGSGSTRRRVPGPCSRSPTSPTTLRITIRRSFLYGESLRLARETGDARRSGKAWWTRGWLRQPGGTICVPNSCFVRPWQRTLPARSSRGCMHSAARVCQGQLS
jgi:predicted ATPase